MKQAVVIMHGMGEQIPMQTLQEFVHAVWETDEDLIDRRRPDSTTGGPREKNSIWAKPDRRNRSYELRRITTESLPEREPTDFYEFYWAHLVHGTTWEHFQAWLVDLLWRSPRRVPKGVASAWILLWVIAIVVVAGALFAAVMPGDLKFCAAVNWCLEWRWLTGIATVVAGIATVIAGWFVNVIVLKYFGDVARYVKAAPPNVARRQEIREKGVELLETLMGLVPGGRDSITKYDRIVVVAHSLGTIVAYDILTHCFARLNNRIAIDKDHPERMVQPERAKLETMIRRAAGLPNSREEAESGTHNAVDPAPLDLEAYQDQQARSRAELNEQGNPWTVSDFITLGAPLTHAEFLLAFDKQDLRDKQTKRVLPTCPPALEYDGTTKLRHFSYRAGVVSTIGKDANPESPRLPHHAALFAFTRWTNLYSPHRAVLWGDLISGPLGSQFGLSVNGHNVSGIRDIPVLPERTASGRPVPGARVPFFSHTKYWSLPFRTGPGDTEKTPHHIRVLREVLNLRRG